MANSTALPAARVADYFFVAGLHDNHLLPAYESAKKYQRTGDNDVSYYQQQERAVASNGLDQYTPVLTESPPAATVTNPLLDSRRRGKSLSVLPTESATLLRSTIPEVATSASLLGVLDHVQNVIDNFDKERDSARDNVIAVHDNPEKYKRSDSDKTITQSSLRNNSYSADSKRRLSTRDASFTRKWRSPSDPKRGKYFKSNHGYKMCAETDFLLCSGYII